MENVVKTYCWACGYECNENDECIRPYTEGGINCRESIYYQEEA